MCLACGCCQDATPAAVGIVATGAPWAMKRGQKRGARRGRARDPGGWAVVSAPVGGSLTPDYGPIVKIARTLTFSLTPAVSDTGWLWNFSLSDVANSSEFTNLFLQWRLDAVTVDIVYTPSSATGALPRMLFSNDPLASAAPTSVTDMIQRRCRVWTPNPTKNTTRILLRPRVCNLVSSSPALGATVENSVAQPGAWYSCSSTGSTVSYGALIAWIENFNSGNTASGTITMYQTYHFAFRGTK